MIADSKSILAKLLAKENIKVEHKNVPTAYFDLKARVLTCPIWTEMSPELYDLLMGHEVSHALNTPEEGWHDEVTSHKGGFKSYLNIVEDARIERKIKSMYPGLKTSFHKAYQELAEKSFFGPDHIIQSDNLPLIDRINLHYKIGYFANIHFDTHEMTYVDRVGKTETWEDVVALAKELHELGKSEKKSIENKLRELMDNLSYDIEDMEHDDYGDTDDSPEQLDFGGDDSGEASEIEELEELLNSISKRDSDPNGDEDIEDPHSVTDGFYRKKELDLLDAKSKPYVYADLPTPKLNKIVIPYKTVHKHCNFKMIPRYGSPPEIPDLEKIKTAYVNKQKEELYDAFNKTNKKYISYLIKEFELRKNAKQFARASVSKTGELDVKKVFSYQFNEDIFKRVTSVPGGKNHGMLMFIDFSGSMYSNIKPTIEQTLLLAIFCRKIGVPFRVFSFSDATNPEWSQMEKTLLNFDNVNNPNHLFSTNTGEIHFMNHHFFMAEYLSSEMSVAEFSNAIKNLLLIGKILGRNSFDYRSEPVTWIQETPYDLALEHGHHLNGTPLDEAVVSSIFITKEFKKNYRLDIVNTIFLTDGQGSCSNYIIKGLASSYRTPDVEDRLEHTGFDERVNFVVRDKETNIQGVSKADCPSTVAYLDLLSKVTGANVVGFYLMNRPSQSRISEFARMYGSYLPAEEQLAAAKSVRQNKYAQINILGYKKMFILPEGRELDIQEDVIVVEDGSNKNDLRKAFMRMQKNKLVNRVFLNKFVEQIA